MNNSKQSEFETHVKNTLRFYSKLSPFVPRCYENGNVTEASDAFTNDCIQKLGVKDEKQADEIFAQVYNYIFGLENSSEDLDDIIEILNKFKEEKDV